MQVKTAGVKDENGMAVAAQEGVARKLRAPIVVVWGPI